MFAKHCEQGSLSNLECASSYKQPPLDVQSMNTSFYYYLLLQQLILLLLLVLLPLSHNGNIQKFAWKRFQPQGLAGQTKCCPNAGPALRAQGLIAMQNKCNKSQSITITSDFGMLHFFPQSHQTSTGPCPGLYCRWLPKCKSEHIHQSAPIEPWPFLASMILDLRSLSIQAAFAILNFC